MTLTGSMVCKATTQGVMGNHAASYSTDIPSALLRCAVMFIAFYLIMYMASGCVFVGRQPWGLPWKKPTEFLYLYQCY
jgi:hypothetical protein